MKGAALLSTLAFVLAACGSSHATPTGPGPKPANAHVTVLRGHSLPGPLLKRIAAQARSTAGSLGDTSVATAQIYGPASRSALVKASSGEFVMTTAREHTGFYLIVLRGHFVCRSCSGPAGAKPPHGTVAANVLSPTRGGTDFGLTDRLAAAMSRLGTPTVIRLGKKG